MTEPSLLVPFLLIVASYLLGSVPFGILVASGFGAKDPRLAGSGNIGATNVARTSGRAAGLTTLAADVLKGALPVYVAIVIELDPLVVSLVALAAFSGHLFSIFLRFRGGKGVATALGVMAMVSPIGVFFAACIFAAVFAVTRYVSLGSVSAAVSLPIFCAVLPWYRTYTPLAAIIAALIIVSHRENLKRLRAGVEKKFK